MPSVVAFSVEEAASLAGLTRQALLKAITSGALQAESVVTEKGPNKGRKAYRVHADTLFAAYPQARATYEARERAAQQAAMEKAAAEELARVSQAESDQLRTYQRRRADCRKGLVDYVDGLMAQEGFTWQRAVAAFQSQARGGLLPEVVASQLKGAVDRRSNGSDGVPSWRTLFRWKEDAKRGRHALAPRRREAPVPKWAVPMLALWRNPNKPSLHAVLEDLAASLPAGVKLPSYSAARRFMDKLGAIERLQGRLLPREIKNHQPFTRRDTAILWPLDVATADGHTFDAEVAHPHTGRPFRPEITTVLDLATRLVVGWSVGLAESAVAVMDALRHAVQQRGVMAIFYVDNGSGYRNHLVGELMERVGISLSHSIAYNSQARGAIERLQKTLWVDIAAKRLPTYMGQDADRQARQIVFKETRKGPTPYLMSWEAFLGFAAACVDLYNHRPHSSLPRFQDPETGRKRHQTPLEAWQQAVDSGWQPKAYAERMDDFMPSLVRTVRRGEISIGGHTYFNRALDQVHGDKVRVAFDPHDASRVWVRNLEGLFLCEAGFEANRTDYFPQSFVEAARATREKAQLRRLEQKALRLVPPQEDLVLTQALTEQERELANVELARLGVSQDTLERLPVAEPAPIPLAAGARPAFKDDREWALWVMDHPDLADDDDRRELDHLMRNDTAFRLWVEMARKPA